MEFNNACLMCNIQVIDKIDKVVPMTKTVKESVTRKVLKYLSETSYHQTNPEIMKKTWSIVTESIGVMDPYKDYKSMVNQQMLAVYDAIHDSVMQGSMSFAEVVHLAVEGNLIDVAASHHFSVDALIESLLSDSKKALEIDHSQALQSALNQGKFLLYIGDNCGELVMDKLLIKYIKKVFPHLKVVFAVRGGPIINDATRIDAEEIGMTEVANVIDNGDSAPGTVLTSVSNGFKQIYDQADVIISKGQGNYESLSQYHDPRVYFLFMSKCQIVSNDVGVPLMSKLCYHMKV